MQRQFIILAAACVVSLAALTTSTNVAMADDPVVGAVEVVKSDSFMCRKLALNPDDTAQHGYVKELTAPKGKAFLVVWARLKLKFAKNEDDEDAVYIADEHMSLKDSKGNLSHIVGTCTRDGRFYDTSGWLSHYKEYLDGDEVEYNPVFVVAEGEQEFTLQLASSSHKFTAPMNVAETIDRTAAADFKIDEVKVIDSLSDIVELRQYEDNEVKGVNEQILSPSTKFLAVKIIIKPKASNDSDGGFYVYSSHFGLRYGKQVYVTPIGHYDGNRFYDGGTGEGGEADAAGEYRAEVMHLVFPLPGKLTAFRGLYLMQEFGGGAIPSS